MASMMQNYSHLMPKQGVQNSFVYGYNRMPTVQKHDYSSMSPLGQLSVDSNLSMLFDKMLGLTHHFPPPGYNMKFPWPSQAGVYNPNVWCGELPPRNYYNPIFSPKVFIGGVPDIPEQTLLDAFLPYGPCSIEWPRGPSSVMRCSKTTGYVYVIFEVEDSVRALLSNCVQSMSSAGEMYFPLRTRRQRAFEFRQVQVIPWVISDSTYIPRELEWSTRQCFLDVSMTIFVGALHGMMTAQILGSIMEEQFGPVVYVQINTDKNKYPIGSGRVTFSMTESYNRAIDCEFLEVRTSKFVKKIQIDPYLKDSNCSLCAFEMAPYFCRHKNCLKYFCEKCFQEHYSREINSSGKHRAIVFKSRRASANTNEESSNLNSPSGLHDQHALAESPKST